MLGAAGYTGRLVAAELARRGVRHRLGARDPGRITVAQERSEVAAVDVTDRGSVSAFLADLDVVINTVGPFATGGLEVIDSAVGSGVDYVDCSGERAYLEAVLERHAQAPVAIVVACGFQAVPGDCGAAIALADVDDETAALHIHYSARMLPSRGTARTLVSELGGETLPRLMPRIRRPLQRAVERLPPGPPAVLRRRDRAHVLVVASGQHRTAAFHAELRDTYGLTARFLVEAALRIEGRGAMTPSHALGAEAFLDAVSGDDESGSFAWFRAGGVA